MIGRKIGHFRIEEKIGEGGMGEVYRAHDTKLHRDVALKILPKAFAQDSHRMARFEREAQVLACLNHAHIAQIHGLEETDGTKALVLELVEGETLGEKIARGTIPVNKALTIALQIAEGLESAHEKGIIHRDLKPGNIKITHEGFVKILDFGLAKALEGEAAASDLSKSPTITHAVTEEGVILGTASYMSPEQTRGKTADSRVDIWAFGCVLYEMLTGERAFGGSGAPDETVSDLLASVLRDEPQWHLLPKRTPLLIRLLLKHCLEKNPDHRLQSIGDARIFITEAHKTEILDAGPGDAAKSWKRSSLLILPWGVLALLALSLAAGWRPFSDVDGQETPQIRFSIRTSGWELPTTLLDTPILDISRDGKQLVYMSGVEGTSRLFLRRIDEFETQRIELSEGATNPFFSPDGEWVGFLSEGRLKKASTREGTVIDICEVSRFGRGTWWGDNGRIVFSPVYQSGLFEVSEMGGVPQSLTQLDPEAEERTHRWPQILPGGDAVLFTIGFLNSPNQYDDAQIAVYSKSTGRKKILLRGGHMARYLSSGHLVYMRSGVLFAAPFDLRTLELSGESIPVSESVGGDPGSGVGYFAVSENGTFVYRPGPYLAANQKLVTADREGRVTLLPLEPNAFSSPRFSPDGRRLAYGIETGSGRGDIWIYDMETQLPSRLTFSGSDLNPVWSTDGQFVYFASIRGKDQGIYRKAYDGSSDEELVALMPEVPVPSSISSDGRTLLATVFSPSVHIALLRLQKDGEVEREDFGTGGGYLWGASYSPDNRWVAYTSNESGRNEVYVEPASGPGKWQLSSQGGMSPVWGPEGRELFFADYRGLYHVGISSQGVFRHTKPVFLFSGNFVLLTPSETNFDISPDGKTFVLVQSGASDQGVQEIRVWPNWHKELKRMVPTE